MPVLLVCRIGLVIFHTSQGAGAVNVTIQLKNKPDSLPHIVRNQLVTAFQSLKYWKS
jgi:hypothetical protein